MRKYIDSHIISIFIIILLTILLIVNTKIRNDKIQELENKANYLEFEKDYILFAINDSWAQQENII